jgi:dihydropyrimidinase
MYMKDPKKATSCECAGKLFYFQHHAHRIRKNDRPPLMQTLITNGRIITADEDRTADVLIDGEKIAAVGRHLNGGPERTIDAGGMYVIPGGVDAHTHLDMPLGNIRSSDDFETGTRAAALGGTTAVIDFATQARGKPLMEALEEWHAKARGKACIDYGFHMVMTDAEQSRLPEMDEMVKEGVTSFKMFMA